eukprot:TRINITY_DN10410_c0_g1_i1.p2 TRINITY_DN10410_c0_g1~~TRINITY_DN10410_c0_g1_i1.p2  ORF type:complete len:121 (-),score=21.55 TRINITY_DN10410_c0_g1_i1:195-557(-)
MDHMHRIVQRFAKQADFIAVYISEAHASDEWKIDGYDVCYRQPRTLDEKIKVASDFVKNKNFQVPLYIDLMDKNAEISYEANPERLYIICDGIIMYKGGPGPYGYHLSEIESFLEKRFSS